MKWICKIGIHKWRDHKTVMHLFPRFVQRCERCRIGKMEMIEGATMTFTKEQMEDKAE